MTFKSSIASLATRLAGYRFDIEEGWPKGGAVFIGAPHTSNWDFAAMLAITWKAGIPVRWLGKSQAFDNPLGFVPRWLGGIPVNRDAPQGMAKALSEEGQRPPGQSSFLPLRGRARRLTTGSPASTALRGTQDCRSCRGSLIPRQRRWGSAPPSSPVETWWRTWTFCGRSTMGRRDSDPGLKVRCGSVLRTRAPRSSSCAACTQRRPSRWGSAGRRWPGGT